MEAAVLEVVLDPGATDPADAAVDHDDLAVVDVTDSREVPALRATAAEWPGGNTRLRRAHDADLHARGRQPVVEGPCTSLGVGSLAVDDEPHGNALRGLGDQRLGELVSHDARPEAELVDVDGRRRRDDVLGASAG